MAVRCEHGNKHFGSIKYGEFLDQLSDFSKTLLRRILMLFNDAVQLMTL
jgi:hypothetical protein